MVGIAKSGGGEGFDLAELMEFVGKAYNSSNADVRACAVKVTREVHDLVGPAIRCAAGGGGGAGAGLWRAALLLFGFWAFCVSGVRGDALGPQR